MSGRAKTYLVVLLAMTAGIRLIGVGRPLLGNFATRNVVSAMAARNWARGRAPLWLPTLDCLARDGQRALHLVEVPVSAYLAGGLWRLLGGSLDVWGRLTSVAFSTAAVGLMFFLVRRWHGTTAAWTASIVLALAPVSVIYGQSFMLEASVVFFTLATLLSWEMWTSERRWPYLLAACTALALLLLTKSYMVVLLLPLAVQCARALRETHPTLARRASEGHLIVRLLVPRWRVGLVWSARSSPRTNRAVFIAVSLVAVLAAIAPAALWLWHVAEISSPDHPLSGRLYYSLRDSAAVHALPHPLLKAPAFYGRVLADLGTVALTPLGLALAGIGLCTRAARRHWAWLAAMLSLVLALPLKFQQMNYYYLVVVPPLCVTAGLGWCVVQERLKPSPYWVAALLLLGAALSFRYAVKPAFVTPSEDNAVLAAAQAMREITSADEPVATMHGSTIDLLYYCDRPGWAIPAHSPDFSRKLAKCQAQGAVYLIVVGQGATAYATGPDDYRVFRLSSRPFVEQRPLTPR